MRARRIGRQQQHTLRRAEPRNQVVEQLLDHGLRKGLHGVFGFDAQAAARRASPDVSSGDTLDDFRRRSAPAKT